MNSLRKIFFALLCYAFLLTPLSAQERIDKIDQVVEEFIRLDLFSGTILVAEGGDVLYAKAFGEADKDFHVPITLDSKFNIGSIGKTLTGTSIMQLAERGELDVMDPVKKYLPDFPYGDQILLHHLLTHTSGLFNYFAHPEFQSRKNRIRSVGAALPLIYDQQLRFKTPGEQFAYSNSGIVVLGAVIEAVSGMSYAEYLQKYILGPLEMNDTGINYPEQVVENRAVGYEKSVTGEYRRNVLLVPPANADGGIETTVGDLLKFDQALYDTKLLSEKSKEKMFTPFLEDYGYCWGVWSEFDNLITAHSGGTVGVNAVFRRYTTDRYTLIVLSNYGGGAIPVGNTIEAILFEQDYELPKPPVDQYLYKILSDRGSDFFLKNHQRILSNGGYDIRSSAILNQTGYDLLSEQKPDLAITIFQLNTILFPGVANVFDSLGEAYMVKGDYAKSRELYNKALEIDPDFTNAIQMLQRLDELQERRK